MSSLAAFTGLHTTAAAPVIEQLPSTGSKLVRGREHLSAVSRPTGPAANGKAAWALAGGAAYAWCASRRNPGQRRFKRKLRAAFKEFLDEAKALANKTAEKEKENIADPMKQEVRTYDGVRDVRFVETQPRGAGKSAETDHPHWWKMSTDRKSIEVIFPIDEDISKNDVIYRLGEDAEVRFRGPLLQMGWKYQDENKEEHEYLVLNGTLTNSIDRYESFWNIEEVGGVRACVLTLYRPFMMRQTHDEFTRTSLTEERMQPQTWDHLFFEDREQPEITDKVFFDIDILGEPAGRIVCGLFGADAPKTVKNFIGLAEGRYTDDEGKEVESAFCYKSSKFNGVQSDLQLVLGNPGTDRVIKQFSHQELKEFVYNLKRDLENHYTAVRAGDHPLLMKWGELRWGHDLVPLEEEMPEGHPTAIGDSYLSQVFNRFDYLIRKGEGAELLFENPDFKMGVDIYGKHFPVETTSVMHSCRGSLTMIPVAGAQGEQGSVFGITLRESPEWDEMQCCFGRVIEGMDLLERIEFDHPDKPEDVFIRDCGLLREEAVTQEKASSERELVDLSEQGS